MRHRSLCLLLSLLLAGCARERLRCDGPLQPINARPAAHGTHARSSPADHAAVTP